MTENRAAKATVVDARGLACPQPVVLTKKALGQAESVTVITPCAGKRKLSVITMLRLTGSYDTGSIPETERGSRSEKRRDCIAVSSRAGRRSYTEMWSKR